MNRYVAMPVDTPAEELERIMSYGGGIGHLILFTSELAQAQEFAKFHTNGQTKDFQIFSLVETHYYKSKP